MNDSNNNVTTRDMQIIQEKKDKKPATAQQVQNAVHNIQKLEMFINNDGNLIIELPERRDAKSAVVSSFAVLGVDIRSEKSVHLPMHHAFYENGEVVLNKAGIEQLSKGFNKVFETHPTLQLLTSGSPQLS